MSPPSTETPRGWLVIRHGVRPIADGDTLHLYYGAADTSIAMATGSIRAILTWLTREGQ